MRTPCTAKPVHGVEVGDPLPAWTTAPPLVEHSSEVTVSAKGEQQSTSAAPGAGWSEKNQSVIGLLCGQQQQHK